MTFTRDLQLIIRQQRAEFFFLAGTANGQTLGTIVDGDDDAFLIWSAQAIVAVIAATFAGFALADGTSPPVRLETQFGGSVAAGSQIVLSKTPLIVPRGLRLMAISNVNNSFDLSYFFTRVKR